MGSRHASWPLPDDPAAAELARRHVRETCGALDREAVDTLVLLVSELVANAVEHGTGPLHMMLDSRDGRVRMEVQDGSTTDPEVQDPGLLSEGGRGLMIVDTLADAWGVRGVPDGKSVWLELDLHRRHGR